MSIAEKLTKIAENEKKIYEAGEKSFWDKYLERMRNGSECSYLFAGSSWNSKTFYPTENIVPKQASHYLFQNFSWWTTPYLDLAQRLEECGVVLDTSQCTGFALFFANCFVTRLPKIDVRGTTSLDRTFQGATVLKTIDELVLREESEGANTFSNTFQNCSTLQDITITGSIQRSISFANSPLTVESMKSIIAHLKNYKGTDSEASYTLTFSSTRWTNLEADSTSPEGTTWQEYVTSYLGWKI